MYLLFKQNLRMILPTRNVKTPKKMYIIFLGPLRLRQRLPRRGPGLGLRLRHIHAKARPGSNSTPHYCDTTKFQWDATVALL